MHFEGFNFHLYLFRLANVSSRSVKRLSDVSFDVVAYLLVKAHLDGPLVGRSSVFESEGHSGIGIHTERRDE